MNQENPPGWQSIEGWTEAENIVRRIGPVAPMLVAGIKAYEAAPVIKKTNDPDEIAKFTREALGFTVKVVPTLKSAFYFAADELKTDELTRLDDLNWSSLLSLFTADEIAGICASSYVYNFVRQFVPPEELPALQKMLSSHMRLCSHLAPHFDGAKSGRVILHGALKILGIASLAAAEPKSYSRMKKKLAREGLPYDLADEESRWGCNHMQLASAWARVCGFGPISRLVWAPDNSPIFFSTINSAIKDCSQDLAAYRGILYCASSLQCAGKLPPGFNPANPAKLEEEAAEILNSGRPAWILGNKTQLSGEVRDALDIKLSSDDFIETTRA